MKTGQDVFGVRNFIENKGQFDKILPSGDKVLYAYENSGECIYFTPRGLVYRLIKRYPLTEKEMERAEKGKNTRHKTNEEHFVWMNWKGSEENIEVEAKEKQRHYFTYGGPELNSYAYKKLVYKNVYPNIDVEYTLPADKAHGIKYSVILHRDADPEQFIIQYSGDVKKILREGKTIHVRTPAEDIVEHEPLSFYLNGPIISTQAIIDRHEISYRFPQGFDKSKEVIIDPWVTTLTSLPTGNYGYDVDYDGAGNLFVYGGLNQVKLAKYSPLGALIWTFSGIVGGISWTSQGPNNEYIGNFVVNKFDGKSYIGQGYVIDNDTRIIRVDANGNYDNWVTPPLWTVEVWDMLFHCQSGRVYQLGGSTIANLSGGLVNQQTATVNVANFTGIPTSGQDVLSSTIDDAGNIFVIFASQGTPTVTNKMMRVNNTFNGNVWMVPSGYSSFIEAGNKGNYFGGTYLSNGYNCLAVNANYLYYYDGYNIAAYNKNTGAQIGLQAARDAKLAGGAN